jgi:hypothetical protein
MSTSTATLTELTLVPIGDGRGDHITRGPTTTLVTAQNHPFWDVTTATGEQQLVVAVDNHTGAAEMRDLTIVTVHTYYVLAGNVLASHTTMTVAPNPAM